MVPAGANLFVPTTAKPLELHFYSPERLATLPRYCNLDGPQRTKLLNWTFLLMQVAIISLYHAFHPEGVSVTSSLT